MNEESKGDKLIREQAELAEKIMDFAIEHEWYPEELNYFSTLLLMTTFKQMKYKKQDVLFIINRKINTSY